MTCKAGQTETLGSIRTEFVFVLFSLSSQEKKEPRDFEKQSLAIIQYFIAGYSPPQLF